MELLTVLILTLVTGITLCWITGNLYSCCRKPAVYFPLSLATKMSGACLLGMALGGIGGVILGALVMNRAFQLRRDYNVVQCVIAGTLISAIVCAGMLLSGFFLAWEIIG